MRDVQVVRLVLVDLDGDQRVMTPEERARADEINAAIERFAKDRKKAPAVTIPGISAKPSVPTIRTVSQERPATSSSGFRYALIFILVGALHVAGFLTYTWHVESKVEEIRDAKATAALMEATARRALARVEAERMNFVFAEQQAQLARQQSQMSGRRTITPQIQSRSTPAGSPKIEYNVYREPTPAPRQVVMQSPQPVEEVQPDRSREHVSIAAAYLSLKGIYARSVSIERISGWDGRYRTEFEVPRNSYTTGTNSPKPKRYEVITEEKGGKITALEHTTKGYY